ncbi:hypothetical protein [Rhodopirellula sp. SWK7]|uniref:hypothetical protein n=1 Tax=Rhodopirellula sp. SWK7 TaxID=595460 RepID=UPI0002BDF278|nr:hypothetical protein [Rhodopirellula sp. SWK7]EMI42687.1 hypothetical protein RRSWK_04876 [Rhodopirellula sp. SWK7]
MSTATLYLDPVAPASVAVTAPRKRSTISPMQMLRTAMLDADEWVVEFEYSDSKGNRTRRTVSPIRFASQDRFLGLCLCREEPRQFYLNRCDNFRLLRSEDVIMPVEILPLDPQTARQ